MNTEKVEDYKSGEIHKTGNDTYIFVEGDRHAGPYLSISALKSAVDSSSTAKPFAATAQQVEVQTSNQESSDTADQAEEKPKATTTKAKKRTSKKG